LTRRKSGNAALFCPLPDRLLCGLSGLSLRDGSCGSAKRLFGFAPNI
jgi:hypothetical protein